MKKFSIDRSDPSRSSAVSAYEVIEVGGLAGQRSVEQEESPVFDKNISYDSQGKDSNTAKTSETVVCFLYILIGNASFHLH